MSLMKLLCFDLARPARGVGGTLSIHVRLAKRLAGLVRIDLPSRSGAVVVAVFLLGLLTAVAALPKPALIPQPQTLEWTAGDFDCSHYALEGTNIAPMASDCLRQALRVAGAQPRDGGAKIVFRQADQMASTIREAGPGGYALEVSPRIVTLTASRPEGFLYGAQTLRQLIVSREGKPVIAGCRIKDWPAFAWRGFMHDVGRNFQEMELLKRFVDVMALYKMNVFHFHLTDNPGYRIECRSHPELNAPNSYLPTRSPGRFYTYGELNDFIGYCRQRGIQVVPEIDMPGHSDYFKRAFGVDMQDEKGMEILSDCVNEFLDHVDVSVVHIGSDEVDLRNKTFLARMAGLVRGRGKQIIVWRPGGLPPGKVITQSWSAGSRENGPLPGVPMLDSRDDYVNHLDPFDLPSRILNLATCGKETGDDLALGGILCHWPDANAGQAMNIYRQSPVFPALVTAAERYWRGHTPQQPAYWGRLPDPGTPEFAACAEFETRMAEHRDRFFADWPFAYVKQTAIAWKLIGPFDHKGDVNALFPVESRLQDEYSVAEKTYRWKEARGATIHVNHFWYAGWLPKAEAGTAYALTYLWSPRAQTVGFWIGFNGPSRSDRRGGPNPAPGQWSTTGSRLWVNDAEVAPPVWKQPGAVKGGIEAPFVDEDYFYRPPTPISLKSGWNKILVKAPKARNTWKWDFTCVPVSVQGDSVREVEGLRFSLTPE